MSTFESVLSNHLISAASSPFAFDFLKTLLKDLLHLERGEGKRIIVITKEERKNLDLQMSRWLESGVVTAAMELPQIRAWE